MTLQWVAADLRTGSVLADLPTLSPGWPLKRTLNVYETATADLYLDGAPPNWQTAVRAGASVLACYDDADPAAAIQWAGMVTQQTRDTSKDAVELSLATVEAYLDRRFVGNVTYTQTGQNAIALDLIARYVQDATLPGLTALATSNVDGAPGTLRDRSYLDADNATVYQRLGELAAIIGGIEFTIEWQWGADQSSLVPVFVVGSRIGSDPPAGVGPAALFSMPGPVTNAQQLLSYADGSGANVVQTYSSGQGASAPTSGNVLGNFAGRPAFEKRYQPSSSITDTSTLLGYAQAAVAMLAPGLSPLTLSAVLTDETRHGGAWRLGGTIGYAIGGTTYDDDGNPYELARMFPGGLFGSARCVAYTLAEDTKGAIITPILAAAALPGGGS